MWHYCKTCKREWACSYNGETPRPPTVKNAMVCGYPYEHRCLPCEAKKGYARDANGKRFKCEPYEFRGKIPKYRKKKEVD